VQGVFVTWVTTTGLWALYPGDCHCVCKYVWVCVCVSVGSGVCVCFDRFVSSSNDTSKHPKYDIADWQWPNDAASQKNEFVSRHALIGMVYGQGYTCMESLLRCCSVVYHLQKVPERSSPRGRRRRLFDMLCINHTSWSQAQSKRLHSFAQIPSMVLYCNESLSTSLAWRALRLIYQASARRSHHRRRDRPGDSLLVEWGRTSRSQRVATRQRRSPSGSDRLEIAYTNEVASLKLVLGSFQLIFQLQKNAIHLFKSGHVRERRRRLASNDESPSVPGWGIYHLLRSFLDVRKPPTQYHKFWCFNVKLPDDISL